jgi:predicted ArsR family transcriptional regulator
LSLRRNRPSSRHYSKVLKTQSQDWADALVAAGMALVRNQGRKGVGRSRGIYGSQDHANRAIRAEYTQDYS